MDSVQPRVKVDTPPSGNGGVSVSLRSCLKPKIRHFRVFPEKQKTPVEDPIEIEISSGSSPDANPENNCSTESNDDILGGVGDVGGNVSIIDRRTSFSNLSKRFRSRNKISCNISKTPTESYGSTRSLVIPKTPVASRRNLFSSFVHLNDSAEEDLQDEEESEFSERFLCKTPRIGGGGGNFLLENNNESNNNNVTSGSSSNAFRKFLAIATLIYVLFVSLQLPIAGSVELNYSPNNQNPDFIQNIWDELTDAEITSIFGSSHASKFNSKSVPNFDIVEPKITHRKSRGKRSLDSPNEKYIQIQGLGRSFNISMFQNRNLLDPHFVFLMRRHENTSEIMPEVHYKDHANCFYHGVAQHAQFAKEEVSSGPVALDLCRGMKGFILAGDSDHESQYEDNHHYVIHPVPSRLHKKRSTGRKSDHDEHYATQQHFLFKRQNHPPLSFGKHATDKRSHEMDHSQTCAHSHRNDDADQLLPKRKRRSTDFFANDPFAFYNGDIMRQQQPMLNTNVNTGSSSDSYWHHFARSNLFTPSRSMTSSAVFPSSYWRHKSSESPHVTGMGNVGLTRRSGGGGVRYDDTEDTDYDHDTSASSTNTRSSSDTDWSKGVLVYESTSSVEEPDTILPFYTKGRKRSKPAGKTSSNWEPMTSMSSFPYSASTSSEGGLQYSQNYSTSSTSSKYYRKGRRDDGYFGSDWKSPLDSDILNSFTKPEKSVKQGRFDLDSNLIYSREREVNVKPPSQLTIETAVFVDKDLYKHMQSNFPDDTHGEVVRIVLAMINAVQLLYHDPSLGHRVDFVLKRLEVLETDPVGLLRPYDIDRFLTNFCKWQKTENPSSDADPLHWDHALILTGLDLYVVHQSGKISNQVVGLAPVAGMCTRSSSCTVNEGRHFESVFVISHEIGHNLGARHDGPQASNDCDPTSHIMSPTLGSGKITWSPCSRKYLDMFLETSQSKCLLDKAKSEIRLDHDADGRLPGERFDADRQCVLKYGRGSFHATQQPLEDVCRDLHCRREHYTWTSHPALEGTFCGSDMWCRAGKCVGKSTYFTAPPRQDQGNLIGSNHLAGSETAAYSVQKAVDGVWGKWSLFTDCSSACLYSDDGSLTTGSTGIRLAARRCDSPRPENGGRQCSGPDRRYKTCSSHKVGKVCSSNHGRTTISQYAHDVCNRASTVDHDLTGMGFMMSTNDAERACSVWCETLDNGVPRSRGWSFPDGTSCKVISQTSSTSSQPQSYCVAGKCQDFACNHYSYYALSDEECTFSSSNEVTPQSSWYSGNSNSNSASGGSGSTTRNGKAGWSDWEPHSECKLACLAPAKGLELVKRLCAAGDAMCTGLALSVRLCKPDKATVMRNGCTRLQTPFEYATKVCSKYAEKIPGLSGIGMQLSPTKDDKDRPCRIGCQDVSIPYRFYMVNGEDGWFPAGTDCSRGDPDKKAYCVAGKCVDFGSDDTPLYRVHAKIMGRIETLFQRNKRQANQASYNIMEPLRVPSSMDESSLRELVHKFSERTGNYPSIATASNSASSTSLDFTRPIVMQNHNHIDYPPVQSHQYNSRSRYTGYPKPNFVRSASSYDSYGSRYPPSSNNRNRESSRGRSLNMDYHVDVDHPHSNNNAPASGRMISSSNGNNGQRNDLSHNGGGESTNWSGPVEGSYYEWRKIVSDCSVSCGKGIQEVIVECVSGDTVVSDRLCGSRPRPGFSGYVDCHRSSCALSQRGGGGGGQENSHIWNWLQALIPKNATSNRSLSSSS